MKSLKKKRLRTVLICSPSNLARSICLTSVVAARKASVNALTVSFLTAVPTPRASTRSAQKSWSPKKGLMIVGIPAKQSQRQ